MEWIVFHFDFNKEDRFIIFTKIYYHEKKNKSIFDAEPQFDFESMSFFKNESPSDFNFDRVELPGDADQACRMR